MTIWRFNSNFKDILSGPILPWVIIFLILNIVSRGSGGTNPRSRYATMRSMAEQASFKIDDYREWTIDWARTPDGHYYSNKAPGPMFLAFPVFWVLEQFTRYDRKEQFNSRGSRITPPSPTPRALIDLIHQSLPYALLCMVIISFLRSQGVGPMALHFTALAMLFGNTASLFMNVFFGHAMTAIFLLIVALALMQKRPFLIGLGFGLALLCEYSAALFLPVILLINSCKYKKDFSWIKPFLLGGILPAIFWCWYHTAAFGALPPIPISKIPGYGGGKGQSLGHIYPQLAPQHYLRAAVWQYSWPALHPALDVVGTPAVRILLLPNAGRKTDTTLPFLLPGIDTPFNYERQFWGMAWRPHLGAALPVHYFSRHRRIGRFGLLPLTFCGQDTSLAGPGSLFNFEKHYLWRDGAGPYRTALALCLEFHARAARA